MPVVDRSHRAVDVVEDAVLHDARAAQFRQSGSYSATQIVHRPRDLYRVLSLLVPSALTGCVLRKPQRLLRDMLPGSRRREREHLVYPLPILQQFYCLLRKHHVVRLAVLRFADRPHAPVEVDVAPERADHLAGAAAGEENERQRFTHDAAVGAMREPLEKLRQLGVRQHALSAHLGRPFDAESGRHEIVGQPALFDRMRVRTSDTREQLGCDPWSLRHLWPDHLVLQLAPRDLQRRPLAEHRQQVLPQNAGALRTALLTAQDFVDVLVDQVLKSVGALALRDPFAGRLLPRLALLELRVLAPLALQPLPYRSITRLRERERPDLAQSDLTQRAIAGAVAIEEDFLSRSQTTHPQSGTLCVAAFLALFHASDNRGGQRLQFFQYRFTRHRSSQWVDLYRHLH